MLHIPAIVPPVADVARQPDHPQKAPLQQKLAAIRQEATARLPPKK